MWIIATKVQKCWFICLIDIQLIVIDYGAFSDGIIFEQQTDIHFWWKICVHDITLNFVVEIEFELGTFSNFSTLVDLFFVAIFIVE